MHPLFLDMMIIRHKFEIPQLALINDELVQTDSKEETYTFTLLHGGIGVFEENYGAPLMSVLMRLKDELTVDTALVLELAAAAYVKIGNGKFENNRATAQEFKQKEVADHLYDVNFIAKLFEMASECIARGQADKPARKK